MYSNKDKRKIYWLIDEYLKGSIGESAFCDEFYYCYDLELNHNDLSPLEKQLFSALDNVVSRYSEYEEDHKLDARAFTNIAELKEIIRTTKLDLENSRL